MHISPANIALHITPVRVYKKPNETMKRDFINRIERRMMIMNPIRAAKNWINYRRTLNELGSLSNQTLNDIGISRHDIRTIAARNFR